MRPKFVNAWAASRNIYDAANSSAKVAKVIGGKVAMNVNSQDERIRWRNTCAVRMSYILNYSDCLIPYITNQTVSGGDRRWYFYRVKNLIAFLIEEWGKPDMVVPYPQPDNGPLKNKKGIILFAVSGWGDAEGHATLWDGTICYDHCYFNEPNVNYKTTQANFWSLP